MELKYRMEFNGMIVTYNAILTNLYNMLYIVVATIFTNLLKMLYMIHLTYCVIFVSNVNGLHDILINN